MASLLSPCMIVAVDGEIVFVEVGSTIGLRDLADSEFVVGVYPDGHGHVIKNRHGAEGGRLSAECVEWLKANPTNRPEDC